MYVEFNQGTKNTKRYTHVDLGELMKLYNSINLGCTGCQSLLTAYNLHIVNISEGNAISINGELSPQEVVFSCDDYQCVTATQLFDLDKAYRIMVEHAPAKIMKLNGTELPLYDLSEIKIQEIVKGYPETVYLNKDRKSPKIMLVNTDGSRSINHPATQLYRDNALPNKEYIYGEVVVTTKQYWK